MVSGLKNTIVFVVLIVITCSLNGQVETPHSPDSIQVTYAAAQRIKEILEEYNSTTLYVDTSEYLTEEDYRYDASLRNKAMSYNLQVAAANGACNDIIRFFARGADIDNTIDVMASPIHYAVNSGSNNAVELLLLLGADRETLDVFGNTPLIVAVRANDLTIAETLIRYGASTERTDSRSSSPMHHSAALGNFTMTDLLLYYDAPTELYDWEGNTPLMIGTAFGYHDIADLLLQSGADPNSADKNGFTPLIVAAQNGDTLMLSLLLDYGAALYTTAKEGIDALRYSIIFGHTEAAAFLLERGNRWDAEGGAEINPVELANRFGRTAILKRLNEHGWKGKRVISFNELSVTAGALFTSHYQLPLVSLSLYEPGIRSGITLGIAPGIGERRLLVEEAPSLFYQYHVSTTVIHAGLYHEIPLKRHYGKAGLSAVPALNIGYRFHSQYAGTDHGPDNSLCIIPSADLKLRIKKFSILGGITWLKTPFYKTGPLWFTLKTSFLLHGKAVSYSGKRIRLYNYDEI